MAAPAKRMTHMDGTRLTHRLNGPEGDQSGKVRIEAPVNQY